MAHLALVAVLVAGAAGVAACAGSALNPGESPALAPASSAVATTGSAAPAPAPGGEADSEDLSPSPPEEDMPKGEPGPDEPTSAKIWAEAVALARDAPLRTLKCYRVVSSTTRYAFANATPDSAAVLPEMKAYLRIARCAELLGSFGFLEQLGRAMHFLETTMTGGKLPFEKAMAQGAKEFARYESKKNAHVADIARLRKDGVTPQPKQQRLAGTAAPADPGGK